MFTSLMGKQYAGTIAGNPLVRNGRTVTVARYVDFEPGMDICLADGDKPNAGHERFFAGWALDNDLVRVTDGVRVWHTFAKWVQRTIEQQKACCMID